MDLCVGAWCAGLRDSNYDVYSWSLFASVPHIPVNNLMAWYLAKI